MCYDNFKIWTEYICKCSICKKNSENKPQSFINAVDLVFKNLKNLKNLAKVILNMATSTYLFCRITKQICKFVLIMAGGYIKFIAVLYIRDRTLWKKPGSQQGFVEKAW